MNAVAYYRYSSHGQTEQSIEGQRTKVEEYARKNGYVILREYIDRAQTGTSDKNRTQFQLLIEDSKKRKFDFVLVYAVDRFGRNLEESITNESKLKKNEILLLSATENFQNNSSGNFHRNMMMSVAQWYSDELSEKLKRGIAESVEKGKYIGGFIPLGFAVDENKMYQLDPATVPVVQKIYELYVAGNSIVKINEAIIEQFGKAYFKNISNSINRILDNPNYKGIYTRGGKEVPGGMPRIISDEMFERVAQIRAKKRASPTSARNDAEYFLTTKLYCGYHGRDTENRVMMVGVSGTSKSGKIHNYYTCKSVWKKKNVKKDYIENFILEKAREQLTDENIVFIAKTVAEKSKQENSTPIVADLKRKLKENKMAIENLLKAIESGEHMELLSERITQKKQEKTDLEKALAREEFDKIEVTEEDVGAFLFRLKMGDENDVKYKRALISIFINAVYLYDDKATIFFNTVDRPIEFDYDILSEEKENADNMGGVGCSYTQPTSPP